jgi:D-apionolactonase
VPELTVAETTGPETTGPETTVQMLRTGTAKPPPEVRALRAGPVQLLFSDGDLRRICHGPVEVARRIYVAIRDLDWNTLPGEMTGLEITDRGDSFAIRFSSRHIAGALDYEWHAEIDGDPDGTISYRMRGAALSAFPYAKIGICVHHPVVGWAGQPYAGSAPGGPVSGRLPAAIGPQIHLDDGTDLPLFDPVSDLDITHADGGVVRFEFTGDLWEMEDQRNWTDASYKSASTPASLGYHHEAEAGTKFDQQVAIRAHGFAAAAQPPAVVGPLTLTVDGATGAAFPPVGLRCSDPGATLSAAGRAALRAIRPAHLRVDVNLAAARAADDLAAGWELARELDCGLELAVFVPGPADWPETGVALGRLRAGLATARADGRVPLARVLAFGATEESSSAATVSAVRDALASAAVTGVPVIGGTNVYFNELNRHRRPAGPADGLAWSVNPQIHAFDDLSLMENLQAQPDTVATARSFAPGTAYFVTPITLRPRFNAVAVTGAEQPSVGLPWQVDVRQPALFGAAWTLGSIAALAGSGVDGLTYYDTQGPAGVIESPAGSPNPAEFFSRPDTPYPLAVVLADAVSLAGGRIRALAGLDPAQIGGIAVDTAGDRPRTTLLLANLTARARDARLRLAGRQGARARILDEHTAGAAAADLPGFLESRSDLPVSEGAVTVTLAPYATARLDLTGE